jgi:integrase
MPWRDVPAFYATLIDPSITHLALRLTILTGARSKPVRHLRLDQLDGDVWTVPGEMMKGRKDRTPDFRVPLSSEALDVIRLARPLARNGYIFPNAKGGVMSDMTMIQHMKRAGLAARPHGFRSSLRDWIEEATTTPFEVAEAMLSHVVGGSTERAYRRTDYLDQRRRLLEKWAGFVASKKEA